MYEASARGGGGWLRERVTVTVTSCGRQSLLEQTLESFLLANDYEFVHEILIMEDSGDAAMCRTLRVLYEGQMGVDRPSIRILCNQQRLGQMRTLDRVWAHVTTPWHKFPKVL